MVQLLCDSSVIFRIQFFESAPSTCRSQCHVRNTKSNDRSSADIIRKYYTKSILFFCQGEGCASMDWPSSSEQAKCQKKVIKVIKD